MVIDDIILKIPSFATKNKSQLQTSHLWFKNSNEVIQAVEYFEINCYLFMTSLVTNTYNGLI